MNAPIDRRGANVVHCCTNATAFKHHVYQTAGRFPTSGSEKTWDFSGGVGASDRGRASIEGASGMKIIEQANGSKMLMPERQFRDGRGVFTELWRRNDLDWLEKDEIFVQSNVSFSGAFVMRGLHYQMNAQGKLIHCLYGRIYQVCVDMRAGSMTFGQYAGQVLDAVTLKAVWVPPGYANGFMALDEGATVHYEMTAVYEAGLEQAVKWDDPAIGIPWPTKQHVRVSDKDKMAPLLSEAVKW